MDRKIRAFLLVGSFFFCLCCIAGCSRTGEDTEALIILEQEQNEEESQYTFAAVTRDDIQVVKKIECVYQQADDRELCFEVSGKKIEAVYVEEGDKVLKGQVVAELSLGDVDERLAEAQYQLERNQLLLEQTKEDASLAIKNMENLTDVSALTKEEKQNYEDSISALKQNYEYQMEDYQDAIAVWKQKLSDLQMEKGQQYLLADMDGTVAYVKENLEGTYSVADECVVTIMDVTQCTFCSEQVEFADYFVEDQPVEIQISGQSDPCVVIPYKMDSWDGMMQFVFADQSENQSMSVGTLGNISLVVEEQKQVLTLPANAVHEADNKSYVYVIGENEIWETKWVTIGLKGKEKVEIKEGLSEGDMVILK